MYKILILFFEPQNKPAFDKGWQKFLGMAENMPGLRKEAVSDIDELVYGSPNSNYKKIHELYFDSREDLDAALASEAGQSAGRWLHSFTNGKFMMMISKHMEATPDEFTKNLKSDEG